MRFGKLRQRGLSSLTVLIFTLGLVTAVIAFLTMFVPMYKSTGPAKATPTSPADEAIDRGNVAAENGNWDSAIAHYTEAIRLDPKDAQAYCVRGATYWVMGDRDKAIADYTEIIRLRPKLALAYSCRGNLYAMRGDWDSAIADFTQAIRLDPSYADAYNSRGTAYEKKGENRKAERDFAEAKRLGLKPQ